MLFINLMIEEKYAKRVVVSELWLRDSLHNFGIITPGTTAQTYYYFDSRRILSVQSSMQFQLTYPLRSNIVRAGITQTETAQSSPAKWWRPEPR